MRFFVTGATGFLGGYVAARCLSEGHDVVAVVGDPDQARQIGRYGVQPHVGSILDPDSMRRGMRGVDGVFHAAEWHAVGERHSGLIERINVDGTRNVLELAMSFGVPRIVYTGSLASYGDTRTGVVAADDGYRGPLRTRYGRSKRRARDEVIEPLLRLRAPIITLQPGVVYGPGDPTALGRLLTRYVMGRVPVVPTRTAYSWGHVEDVADVHFLAMQRGVPGRTYIVGGPHHTLREVIGIVARLAGKRRPPFPVPGPALRPAAWGASLLGLAVPAMRGIADSIRATAGTTYLGDDGPARRELGFDPRPVSEGIPDTVRSLLQELFEG